MGHDKTRAQRKTIESASASRVPAGADNAAISGSPAMLAQRKQIASAFGAAQLAGMPEEELQKKSPEDELQKKPDEEFGA